MNPESKFVRTVRELAMPTLQFVGVSTAVQDVQMGREYLLRY